MSDEALRLADDRILAPAGLGHRDLDRLLGQVMDRAVDAADIYFQSSR